MAPIRRHGGHRYNLSLGALAAGSANDSFEGISFDAFAVGSATATGTAGLPTDQESVSELVVATSAVLTGQATNFASIAIQQYSAAGVVKNDIRVVFSATGIVTAAFVPLNFAVASGAAVAGAGTGTLTVQTGTALPWILAVGDSIVIARISNNATGLATPALWATFLVGSRGV